MALYGAETEVASEKTKGGASLSYDVYVENFRLSARVTPKYGLQGTCRRMWELREWSQEVRWK